MNPRSTEAKSKSTFVKLAAFKVTENPAAEGKDAAPPIKRSTLIEARGMVALPCALASRGLPHAADSTRAPTEALREVSVFDMRQVPWNVPFLLKRLISQSPSTSSTLTSALSSPEIVPRSAVRFAFAVHPNGRSKSMSSNFCSSASWIGSKARMAISIGESRVLATAVILLRHRCSGGQG